MAEPARAKAAVQDRLSSDDDDAADALAADVASLRTAKFRVPIEDACGKHYDRSQEVGKEIQTQDTLLSESAHRVASLRSRMEHRRHNFIKMMSNPFADHSKLTLVADKRTIRLEAVNAEFIVQRLGIFNPEYQALLLNGFLEYYQIL